MASYVPWYGKKRAGFKRREEMLLRILARGGAPDAVMRAAEEVRAARMRALKSDQSRIPPCGRDDYPERLAQFDEEIARWASISVEEIVKKYRRRLGAPTDATAGSDDHSDKSTSL